MTTSFVVVAVIAGWLVHWSYVRWLMRAWWDDQQFRYIAWGLNEEGAAFLFGLFVPVTGAVGTVLFLEQIANRTWRRGR